MPTTSEPRVAPIPPGTAVDCGGGGGVPDSVGVGVGTPVVVWATAGAATVRPASASAIAAKVRNALKVAEAAQRIGARSRRMDVGRLLFT